METFLVDGIYISILSNQNIVNPFSPQKKENITAALHLTGYQRRPAGRPF